MFALFFLHSILLQMCLCFPMKPVISAFEEDQVTLHCICLITDGQLFRLPEIFVPMYINDFHSPEEQIRQQSQLCKNHIISTSNMTQAIQIIPSNRIRKVGRTALILESYLPFGQLEKLVKTFKPFSNLAIFVKRQKIEGYTVFRFHYHDESESTESGIELLNILQKDKFQMPNPIFINDELHGMSGKSIILTSFEQ